MSGELNRINEAVQLTRTLDSILNDIQELETSIDAIASSLEDIKNNRKPDLSDLKSLELESATGFVLSIKLQGMLQVKQERLLELKLALKRNVEILEKLSVCPSCKGSGEILSHQYERFERSIQKTVHTSRCEHCKGTGAIELGPEVTRIINAIKDRINI